MPRRRRQNSGKAPRAQYVLAEQVTRLVHGEEGLEAAKRITESLFNGNLSDLSEADFEQLAQDGVPMIEMEKAPICCRRWLIPSCSRPAVRRVKPLPLTR